MSGAPVLACRGVGKVFRSYQRVPGLLGIWRNFVRRQWEDVPALVGVDLQVERGEFVGLIGSNGAGKTTLVKCLTGIIPTSSGSAELLGKPSFHLGDEEKRRLSVVMGQRSQLWWDLPPLDSFHLLREIYQVPRADFRARLDEYAGRLEVTAQLGIQLRHLSLGQRMKMEIIGAFLHQPEVVFLDEPTIGLDLVSRETIRRFLIELNRDRGATILLTSHDMEDIEETCRRLVILQSGEVLFDGDLVDLHRRLVDVRAVEVHLEPGGTPWRPDMAAEVEPFGAELVKQGTLSLTFTVPAPSTQRFVQRLFDLVAVRDLNIERQPLEDLIREIFRTRRLGTEAGSAGEGGA